MAKKKKAAPAPKAFNPAPRSLLTCARCPRLVAHRTAMGANPRKSYENETYWAKPVPGVGDIDAGILLLGLAPGAHGSNRTGRMFTGDASGDFLFPALHRNGFSNQPTATSRTDGLTLTGIYITAAGRCAPPDNKPTLDELKNCQPWLERDLAAMRNLRVVVALGLVAHNAWLNVLANREGGQKMVKAQWKFAHGAEHSLPDSPLLIDSYHVSAQNTYTGKLTPDMFDAVLQRARQVADA